MNSFWSWMEYKEYNKDFPEWYDEKRTELISHQLIIGYMFEYLMERYKGIVDVDLAISDKIKDFYNKLKENILELDR